ncbi:MULTISPECIES: fimbrial protein [unclassified Xenorhabdus]|uniref:fimbrial protein n=1 Tax=unclassified Xenorhabdus TaxID=2632833 RepID=UPI000C057B38|nr:MULTISPECIES: fimbrial protein [unclassified Xenorhabdus]MCC8381304.1 fimbrial protein [Xenorhabdus sp. PB30.3]PHM53928.1 putative fimbrial subunit protein [Xenorhabdus sp. KK7.4]
MKTKLIISSLFISSVFMPLAHAEDGQIQFKGVITADACKIDSNSQNQTVNMGTVSTQALSDVNRTAAATRFSIKLVDCPKTITHAKVKFDGPTNEVNKNLLALSNVEGAANGVAIGIYEDDNNTPIPIATSSKLKEFKGNSTELDFVAKYVATKSKVTPGIGNAVASFTIDYN